MIARFGRLRLDQHVAALSACAALATATFSWLQVDVARKTWRDQAVLTQQVQSCGAIMKAVGAFGVALDDDSAQMLQAMSIRGAAGQNDAQLAHVESIKEKFYFELRAEDVFFGEGIRATVARLRSDAGAITDEFSEAIRSRDKERLARVRSDTFRRDWSHLRDQCHAIVFPDGG